MHLMGGMNGRRPTGNLIEKSWEARPNLRKNPLFSSGSGSGHSRRSDQLFKNNRKGGLESQADAF